MKTIAYLLMTPLAVALFVGGACGGARADPLVSSATGFVSDTVTGVVGPWYSNADSIGPMASPTNGTDFADSPCGKGGLTMDQCSNVVSPVGGQSFAPTDMKSSKMCTNGTAAKIINGPDGTPDSWMGATSETSPLTVGHNIIKWADVGGPLYLAPTVPPPFDKTHVQTINFWVATVATSTTPYSFCVANLALIPN
jgi:hypothetical protein